MGDHLQTRGEREPRGGEGAFVVVHLGPALDEPGGMAQVVELYRSADLQPWEIEFVSTYTSVSRVRQLLLLLGARRRAVDQAAESGCAESTFTHPIGSIS